MRCVSREQMRRLCLMCCLVYFVSYLTRLDYAVCMVEIQEALQIGKNIAGLPVTACFLSYGTGQILCGFMGDKCQPGKMIFTGLTGSAACNLLMLSAPWMDVMIPAWCVNGFFQSMLWPPLVRIMAENLDEDWYRKGCVWVSLSSSGATVMLYLLAPLFIQIWGWKAVFHMAVTVGIITAFVWYRYTSGLFGRGTASSTEEAFMEEAGTKAPPGADARKKDVVRKHSQRGTKLFAGVPIMSILLAIILHGTLKDGITTWMPVYMSEMFGMSSSQSILSTAVLPVCSVFSTLLSSALLYRLKNEVLTAALLFGTGTVAGVVMLPVRDSHPVVCAVMMMLITGCMYGINLMLISRVPGHFAGRGKISTVSGVLNAATYVGSALSVCVFGAVAENAGWMLVVAIWGAAALGGTLLLAPGIRKWGKFCRAQKSA